MLTSLGYLEKFERAFSLWAVAQSLKARGPLGLPQEQELTGKVVGMYFMGGSWNTVS